MAFPTFQAAGAIVESAAADVSPAWPTHQANDIALLIVHSGNATTRLSVRAGFQELPVSPQRRLISSTLDCQLNVYWKRATGAAEGAPTVKFVGDQVRAQIITFRGCGTQGRPFTTCKGSTAAGSTAVTFPALTTTENDSLVVDILGFTLDSAGAKLSGWANAGLTNLTEQVDSGSIIGSGSGFAVSTGQDAVPGALGGTTATLATAADQAMISLALTAVNQPTDKIPFLKMVGTPAESATVAVSPAWPEHVSGDVALLIVEAGGWPITLSTPAGFTEVGCSPQSGGVSGSSAGTALALFWKRATSAAEGAPTVAFVADHVRAQIITFGNVVSAGDPINVCGGTGTGGGATSTSISIPGATTSVSNNLVVGVSTTSRDVISRNEFSGWANANLDYVTERWEEVSTIGSGSGHAVVTGEQPGSGATGTFTGNLGAASHQGSISVALMGVSGADFVADKGTFTLAGQAAGLLHDRVITADAGAFASVGYDADFFVVRTFTIEAEEGVFSLQGLPVSMVKTSRGWSRQLAVEHVWTKQPKLKEP